MAATADGAQRRSMSKLDGIPARLPADAWMLGPIGTIALGALVLVLVSSLPAVSGARVWPSLAVWFGALLATALVITGVPGRFGYRAIGAPASSVMKARTALSSAVEKNVLIVSGGSYAASGVDTSTLERELRALGHSVKAIKLAINASNHFERFKMFEELTRASAGPLPGQRWIYLAEVQVHYDRSPLAQLERNQDTARAYYYLSPLNALTASRALSSSGIDPVDVRAHGWVLLRHALIRAFNVGLDERLTASEEVVLRDRSHDRDRSHNRSRSRSRSPRTDRKRSFTFDAVPLMREAHAPGPPVAVPSWLFDIREPREKAVWSRHDASLVYFGVPSTSPEQLRYIRSFCGATRETCLSPDARLLARLKASSWKDAGHMTPRGAKRYSEWFARELDRAGVLRK